MNPTPGNILATEGLQEKTLIKTTEETQFVVNDGMRLAQEIYGKITGEQFPNKTEEEPHSLLSAMDNNLESVKQLVAILQDINRKV